jgi:cell division control protein 6
MELPIHTPLIKNSDPNKAHVDISNNNNIPLDGISKVTLFQSVNYLKNFGLIMLIRKKIDRYYNNVVTNIIIL